VPSPVVTLEEFFRGADDSRTLFEHVLAAVESLGPVMVRVTKSQVAFRRRIAFAWVWMPRVALRGRGAPLVLTVGLRRRDASGRWKEVVEPYPGRFTHHLELWTPDQVDEQVIGWLSEAWDAAG